ncbi:MAG: hypothetical protein LUF30_02910 [Lachnospiraceae bacterium]|nr:hypothetical protein [Lachnospiraceae bacterium]
MTQVVWWIPAIDWRISAGVIFFIQLVTWGYGIEKRNHFGGRGELAFLFLCGESGGIRDILEEGISARILGSLGYGLYLWALAWVFIVMYRFCYETTADGAFFAGILALTVYRMCWDAVKLISCIPVPPDAGWIGGSPIQSVGSYALYLFVIAVCCKAYRYFIKRQVQFPLYAVRTIFGVVLLLQMLLEFAFQYFYREEGTLSMLYFLTALLYCLISYTLLVVIAYVNLLQQDYVTMENFIKSKQQYYEISKDGILSLQIKCHDLKHQIAQIRSAAGKREMDSYISGLEDCINEYNTVIDSGNQNVDAVLTEKTLSAR